VIRSGTRIEVLERKRGKKNTGKALSFGVKIENYSKKAGSNG